MKGRFLTAPGKPAPKYSSTSPREAWVLEAPESFTAFSFRGRGNTKKVVDLPTKEAAYAAARGLRAEPDCDRGVLIYAVRGTSQALVGAVD